MSDSHDHDEPAPASDMVERKIEKELEDTFPASDPPASTGTTGPTGDRKPGPSEE